MIGHTNHEEKNALIPLSDKYLDIVIPAKPDPDSDWVPDQVRHDGAAAFNYRSKKESHEGEAIMIAKRSELKLRALSRWPLLAGLILLALIAAPRTIIAGEGGVTHVIPRQHGHPF